MANLFSYRRITNIAEMRKDLSFRKPYIFRNTTISPLSSLSKSQSLLSQSFGHLAGLGTTGELLKKRKSINDRGSPFKRSRSGGQSPNKVKRKNKVNSQKTNLYTHNDSLFKNRIFNCLVILPANRTLRDFKELLKALRDATRALKSLYIKGKILYRDISENNIIITDPKEANGFTGMLIDTDLSKEIGSGKSSARYRIKTVEFMPIQVL